MKGLGKGERPEDWDPQSVRVLGWQPWAAPCSWALAASLINGAVFPGELRGSPRILPWAVWRPVLIRLLSHLR